MVEQQTVAGRIGEGRAVAHSRIERVHLELDTGLARKDAQRFYEREQPNTTGYSYSWAL